ncbi:MAG TPA: alpha/beta hydrolase [Clostridiaceae bacterium]|nr:alpha/beta hydrolase [Clostridiaceae bacterium]
MKGSLSKTNIFSSLKIQLVHSPVVYIHGYQENSTIFENLKEYLNEKGIPGILFNYESEEGIEAGAEKLGITLDQIKNDFLQKGIQINKFNLIAHSMGGLVARYYTSHSSYIQRNDVGKIIFIAVPQKGSALAALGSNYFQDKGIRDLSPGSTILSEILPQMINKGLNSTIQVGNIVSEFDEVVNLESASLGEWGIKTHIFNIGKNRITVDNLLNGSIIEAWNHKAILSNKKVFEMIYKMLTSSLPYPRIISP